MNAPFCPTSRSQPATNPRGLPTTIPSIPIATDLPSLIRAVNIIRDILRTLTTSLTVNNTYVRQGTLLANKSYLMSSYPSWQQEGMNTTAGFVFHKVKNKPPDPEMRAYIIRTDAVEFLQPFIDNDKHFVWRYTKPLDSEYGARRGIDPFREDFFERIVNVNWGGGLAVEFGAGDEPAPPASADPPTGADAEPEMVA